MKFGYEGIKSIKSGTVRLAENNKTVNKVYLDLVDEFENTANFTFSIDQAEHVANQLLQAVFELTETKKESPEVYHSSWTAATATGVHATTIQKYIKDGKIPAAKDEKKKYFKIDPYELHKLLPIDVDGVKSLKKDGKTVANWWGYSS
jgi:hypothetical protein